jgi:hypothetical protein
MRNIILSTAYLPPIQYFSKWVEYDNVLIEIHEHYQKQSYRNRCRILGPNGVQDLIIPVVRGRSRELPIKEIKVDYAMSWTEQHLRAIMTAYRSAPFFEHYFNRFEKLYQKKDVFLFDWNMKFIQLCAELLGLSKEISFTQSYIHNPLDADFRERIHPKSQKKQPDDHFYPVSYFQVFSDRFEFQANLSIIDLLMNEGNLSKSKLLNCIQTD